MASTDIMLSLNPLIASPTKWSSTFKQFVAILPTNCLSVFDHFVKLALKGLRLLKLVSVAILAQIIIVKSILNIS